MRFITCFGGGADEGDEAVAQSGRSKKSGSLLASSFRRKFLSPGGKGGKKRTEKPSPADFEKTTRDSDLDSVFGGASSTTSSSSAPLMSLSSASSLSSSSCSSSVSSSSVLRAFVPSPHRASKRQARAAASRAAGAAAVVLCLLMVVLCGKIGATLITSTALYLLPRRCSAPPRKAHHDEAERDPVRRR